MAVLNIVAAVGDRDHPEGPSYKCINVYLVAKHQLLQLELLVEVFRLTEYYLDRVKFWGIDTVEDRLNVQPCHFIPDAQHFVGR